MTVSEIVCIWEAKRPAMKGDYAGGMTEGDIEQIRADAAAHREELARIRAQKNVTPPA